ncbi:MAG: hypothetical protein ACFHX7_03840 [Pseudomonadota bacterium]
MPAHSSVVLHIGNALPHGGTDDSKRIVALWRRLGRFFDGREVSLQAGASRKPRNYQMSLDCSAVIRLLNNAVRTHGSFNNCHAAWVQDAGIERGARLTLQIGNRSKLSESESHEVAALFLQQLVLATNITLPGAIQLLDVRFEGPGAHRYEAQRFDSRVMTGTLQAARANTWPALNRVSFPAVWNWLAETGSAHTDTAIRGINKVLFSLLKIAEQRNEFSARTVLMLVFQLEVLLDCRHVHSHLIARNRAQLILGKIPEAADCFAALYDIRNSLFMGDQPVHRPQFVAHDAGAEIRDQLDQHHTTVELGNALVLALLQDLVRRKSLAYQFTEHLD